MWKFGLKLKNSLKNAFFRRCGQNDGSFWQYGFSEYDISRNIGKEKDIYLSYKLVMKNENYAWSNMFSRIAQFHDRIWLECLPFHLEITSWDPCILVILFHKNLQVLHSFSLRYKWCYFRHYRKICDEPFYGIPICGRCDCERLCRTFRISLTFRT